MLDIILLNILIPQGMTQKGIVMIKAIAHEKNIFGDMLMINLKNTAEKMT
jgi:hypothetical protein